MKKLIHEKRILLDALDTEDQANNYSRSSSSMHEKQIIENLKKEIMAVQTKLDERGMMVLHLTNVISYWLRWTT